jgi:hypothetical protein
VVPFQVLRFFAMQGLIEEVLAEVRLQHIPAEVLMQMAADA